MEVFQEEKNDAFRLLKLFYRKRFFIIGITVLAGIMAACISIFLLPKKYQSEAIIYPTPSNSAEQILDNPSFGFEGQSNQLLQVLQSGTLRDDLIRNFKLIDYYEIDTTNKDWYSSLQRAMDEDIHFTKTPYYSISITAQTEKPEFSASIVNYIVDDLDSILHDIFTSNIQMVYKNYQSEYESKQREVSLLLDSLVFLKQTNSQSVIRNIDNQIKSTYQEITRLQKDLLNLSNKYSIYSFNEQLSLLTNQYANSSAHYNKFKGQYDQLRNVLKDQDTSLLKIKGEMQGALMTSDSARKNLNQLKAANESYQELKLLLNKNLTDYANLKEQKQNLINAFEPTINSTRLERLQSKLHFAQDQLQNLQARYEKARNISKNGLPSVYVISRGRPSYKKASPHYLINTLSGMVLGFVFSLGWVVGSNRWQKLKRQLKDENPV